MVISVGELTGRAVELDLLERPQGDRPGTDVLLLIIAVVPARVRRGRAQDRLQREPDRPRGEQHCEGELYRGTHVLSPSSSRRSRSSSAGVAPCAPSGVAPPGAGAPAAGPRRRTNARADPAPRTPLPRGE